MPSQKPGTVAIPEPRGLPLLGHITEFKSDNYVQDFDRLHDTHGKFRQTPYVFLGPGLKLVL